MVSKSTRRQIEQRLWNSLRTRMENSGWYILNHQIVDGLSNWTTSAPILAWKWDRTTGRTRRTNGLMGGTGCSLNTVFFLKMLWFIWTLPVLPPALCVCTHWRRGKTEKGQSPEYFKIFEKNTIYNELPVYPIGLALWQFYVITFSHTYVLCILWYITFPWQHLKLVLFSWFYIYFWFQDFSIGSETCPCTLMSVCWSVIISS